MKEMQDVKQLIIVPPCRWRENLLQQKQSFIEYMMRRFPNFGFDLVGVAPVEEDEHFIVIPIMNYVTPDGDSYMCKPAPPWLLEDIRRACGEFKPETRPKYLM